MTRHSTARQRSGCAQRNLRWAPRWLAGIAALLNLALIVGCSAAGPVAVAASAVPTPTDVPGWERELERAARRGDDLAVLRASSGLRALGDVSGRALSLEAAAAVRTGAAVRAKEAGTLLAAAAAKDKAALEALNAYFTFLTLTRKDGAEAVRIATTAWPTGCSGPAACGLVARLLVAVELDDEAYAAALAALAPARTSGPDTAPSPQRIAWWTELARALADAWRFPQHAAVIALARKEAPRDPEVWGAWFFVTTRQRGGDARMHWLKSLRSAAPSLADLRAIAGQRDVARDRLMVADVLELAANADGATEDDFVAWVRCLGANYARGGGSPAGEQLRRIAGAHGQRFVSLTARLALAAALLITRQGDAAAHFFEPALALNPPDYRAEVLDAERLRLAGNAAAAEARAAAAVARDLRAAPLLAQLWARAWPAQARRWSAVRVSGGLSLEGQLEAVRMELRRPTPLSTTTDAIRRLVASLEGAEAEAPRGNAIDVQTAVASLAAAFLDRAIKTEWRQPALVGLAGLCASAESAALTCAAAAQVAYRMRNGMHGLALWRRAVALAEKQGVTLDTDALAATIVGTRDASALGRWIVAAGVDAVGDLRVSWQIAMLLLDGPHPSLGRLWVDHTLARRGGAEVLLDRLPHLHARYRRPGAEPKIADQELELAATSGAADILLEHLGDLRSKAGGGDGIAEALRFGRIEVMAAVALGRGDHARRVLRHLVMLPKLTSVQQFELLELSRNFGVCDVAMELAIQLVLVPELARSQRAITVGLECGRARSDGDHIIALINAFQRGQPLRDRQLWVARQLLDHGMAALANGWYARLLGDPRTPTSPDTLRDWARALMELNRPAQADEVLARSLPSSPTLRMIEGARAVDLLVNYERVEAATALLDRLITAHDDPQLRIRRAAARCRLGQLEPLVEDLQALAGAGVDGPGFALLDAAVAATGRATLLHQALGRVVDGDRGMDRYHLKIATTVGDREAISAAVLRLRGSEGSPPFRAVIGLAIGGDWRGARAVNDALIAPAEGGGPELHEASQLVKQGLFVARDSTSTQEALAIARTMIARSLDPHATAMKLGEALRDEGFPLQAEALFDYAAESGAGGRDLDMMRGDAAYDAGDRLAAVDAWRRVASTLTAAATRTLRVGKSDDGVRVELIFKLRRMGAYTTLRRWLQLWVEANPQEPALWAQWIIVESRLGDVDAALEVWQRAEQTLANWSPDDLASATTAFLQAGGGPRLARVLAAEPTLIRAAPWWQIVALEVLRDHGGALPAEEVQVAVKTITASASATALGRYALARHYATMGQVRAAVEVLGDAPFLYDRREGKAGVDVAVEAASACAATLVALALETPAQIGAPETNAIGPTLHQRPAATGASDASVFSDAGAAWPALQPIVARWMAIGGTRADLIGLAEHLTRSGYPDLGLAAVRTLALDGGPIPLDYASARSRLIVHLGGSDEVGAAAVVGQLAKASAGRVVAFDHGRRRGELAVWALDVGSPALSDASLQTKRRVPPVATPWYDGGGALAPSQRARLRRFDASALDEVLALQGVEFRALLDAFAVALATSRDDDAVMLSQRAVVDHDEPWHLRTELIHTALRWHRSSVARRLLENSDPNAPAGVYACLRVAAGIAGADLDPCLRGRKLLDLDSSTLIILAPRIGQDESTATKVIAAAPAGVDLSGTRRWLVALAAAAHGAPTDQRSRLRRVAEAVIAALPPQAQRPLEFAALLDELSALGLHKSLRFTTAAALAANPKDYGALNNHAYASLLVDAPMADVIALAREAHRRAGGRNADALLDTMGAIELARGQHAAAMRWQQAAVALSPTGQKDTPTLVHVRLGEIAIALGQAARGRAILGWVLLQADERDALTLYRARAALAASFIQEQTHPTSN